MEYNIWSSKIFAIKYIIDIQKNILKYLLSYYKIPIIKTILQK